MKDAWDTVTPATVSHCFRKASLLSGYVSVNNKKVTEGEPAFSEWLKQSEIKTFEHVPDIEDFVNADDDLATSGVPTDDIIDAVLLKEDSDEYIEETVPAKPLVTYKPRMLCKR
jgi:hypothetical protein